MTPTARTLKELRELGFIAQVVEKFNRFSKRRIDLFGCIDIIAARAGVGVLGIQATSGDNHAARMDKARAEPRLREWLAAGGRFAVWSWSKRGPRGKRKLWVVRKEEIAYNEIEPPAVLVTPGGSDQDAHRRRTNG